MEIDNDRSYMIPAEDFSNANKVFGPPKGMTENECNSLPVCVNDHGLLSCWELTDHQIEKIKKSKKIYLQIHSYQHPMVSLWTEDPIGIEYIALDMEKH